MKMSFGVIVILESFIIINWQDMNLSKTQSKHSLGILSLLIKLQSLTPILHHDIHKFLLSSISSMKVSDKHVLMSTLNQFKIRQELLPGKNLMILQKAIVNKNIVRIELEDKR